MKKLSFFLVMIAFCGHAIAQWNTNGNNIYNTNTGNVGIGNNSPATLLHVEKNMTEPAITVQNLGGFGGATYSMIDNASGANWKFKATLNGGFKIRDHANGLDVIVIDSNSFANAINIKSTGNIGIGTTSPNNSALVDMSSTTKGFLPPRMTTSQRDAISSPVAGLTIYNTSRDCNETYNGSSWVSNTHYVGESYGGGIVFYVYDNGQHGLIAATTNQSTGIRWYGGSYINTRARADGVGAGLKNTSIIIANQGPVDGNEFAATVCNEYSVTVGGVTYGDWYLPSKHELNLLYLQKAVVGGFASNYYWSSSEYDSYYAWFQFFGDGYQAYNVKYNSCCVRAVRAF